MTSQAEFPVMGTPSRPVPGVVPMALDGNGIAQAADANNPIPVTLVSGGGGGGASTVTVQNAPQAGVSAPSGTVGTTSAVILAAGALKGCCCIQNTSSNGNTLFISFGRAATATDFAIAAGGSIFLHFGPTNTVNGLGSAAATTFAIIGY